MFSHHTIVLTQQFSNQIHPCQAAFASIFCLLLLASYSEREIVSIVVFADILQRIIETREEHKNITRDVDCINIQQRIVLIESMLIRVIIWAQGLQMGSDVADSNTTFAL